MVLDFHGKILKIFDGTQVPSKFFCKFEVYLKKKKKKLEFLELEFHKLKFQKGGRSLHIFKTVVDC